MKKFTNNRGGKDNPKSNNRPSAGESKRWPSKSEDRPARKSSSRPSAGESKRWPSKSEDRQARKSSSRPSTGENKRWPSKSEDRPAGRTSSRPSTGENKRWPSKSEERPARKPSGRPSTGENKRWPSKSEDRPARKPSGRPSTGESKRWPSKSEDRPARKTSGRTSTGESKRWPSKSEDRPERKSSGRPSTGENKRWPSKYEDRPEGRTSSRPSKGARKRGINKSEVNNEHSDSKYSKQNDFRKDNERNERASYKTSGSKSYSRKTYKEADKKDTNNEIMRLNRYISNAGICSRREADKLIGAGLVSVNGQIITEMGHQVNPGDEVKYNGQRLNADKKVYLIMNKPKDTITTLDDPDGRHIVTDLIKDKSLPRIYPVGRLDRNTTGVLILTNDGELAQRLMHPKYLVQKIYKAELDKNFKGEDLWELTNGIELEDGPVKPDSIAVDPGDKKQVVVEIHVGRNRIIHRTFEHMGYKVDKLDRMWYAGLDKRGLKRGDWRHLNEKELTALKKMVKLK